MGVTERWGNRVADVRWICGACSSLLGGLKRDLYEAMLSNNSVKPNQGYEQRATHEVMELFVIRRGCGWNPPVGEEKHDKG